MTDTKITMTRAEYMSRANEEGAFRAYYAQFVTPGIRAHVLRCVASAPYLRAEFLADSHLNGIPLHRWDDAAPYALVLAGPALKSAGDYPTLGGGVCILKEAARQIAEEENA